MGCVVSTALGDARFQQCHSVTLRPSWGDTHRGGGDSAHDVASLVLLSSKWKEPKPLHDQRAQRG